MNWWKGMNDRVNGGMKTKELMKNKWIDEKLNDFIDEKYRNWWEMNEKEKEWIDEKQINKRMNAWIKIDKGAWM